MVQCSLMTGQTKRFSNTITDLITAAERLDFNSQNNGDPEALELGARMLAKAKMRNTSATYRGTPSLLQPLNPAGSIYGQPQMLSHDPWRTGAVNNFASTQPIQPPPSSSSEGDNKYSPGASYQIQPPGVSFPNAMDMNAPESGYEPVGGAQGQPPGYPPQPERPPQPDFTSPHLPPSMPGGVAQPQHPLPSNQPWNSPGDTEASGLSGNGEGGSWNQGELWQKPLPPSSNPWEPHRPPLSPQSQPQPSHTPDGMGNNYQWPPNYYPDQQGSGDGVLPNAQSYPQPPPPVGVISTTATSPQPPTTLTTSTTISSTTTTTTTPIPISAPLLPALPSVSSVSESTVKPVKVEKANASLPPPPPPASVSGFDDEDFGRPTGPSQPLPTSTKQPWGPHQPVPPFEPEASAYYPESEGIAKEEGGTPQFPPPAPPDCSPEAIASAGSGADPRCLTGGELDQSVAYPNSRESPSHWQSPEDPGLGEGGASSGLPPEALEPPPPPPPHPYPSYVETPPGNRPQYGGLPNFEGLVPLSRTPLPPTDLNPPYLPPPATQRQPSPPSTTAAPPRELPPDIWLPVPELQPGDPKLPDSKLLLSDFPPHRGRPMLGVGKENAAMSNRNYLFVIAPLLITANLV
ncbi:unnamed protein product [Hydatigera taeniaeformis]|uniref:SH2 domain-containing protein n=1 Tax=Hydatigena taeniaeformis TaxID=6205 RepID=A0A0R3WRU6_HYDTA|nr:unnamed protein product [Hydatigera taeniaeformis]